VGVDVGVGVLLNVRVLVDLLVLVLVLVTGDGRPRQRHRLITSRWRPREGLGGSSWLLLSGNPTCFKSLGHPRLKPRAANQARTT